MMTTISGQLPTPSVSLVPTTSQTQEQKIPLLVPPVSVAASMPDFASSNGKFVSMSTDVKVSEPAATNQESKELQPESKVEIPEVVAPQPTTLASYLPATTPPEDTPQTFPSFGSRTSAFVPYVNLNNYMSIHSYSSSSEPLYIPPTSHITAPVQMYQDGRDPWNFKKETLEVGNTVLSQYFSQQNQVSDLGLVRTWISSGKPEKNFFLLILIHSSNFSSQTHSTI